VCFFGWFFVVKLWCFDGGMWCFDGRFLGGLKMSLFSDLFLPVGVKLTQKDKDEIQGSFTAFRMTTSGGSADTCSDDDFKR
jgi:hypothetical protein